MLCSEKLGPACAEPQAGKFAYSLQQDPALRPKLMSREEQYDG
jgi:hypothetical protein